MTKVFIVGNSRSGTTMLGRIMGRNSKIHTFRELHFFENIVDGPTVMAKPVWSVGQAESLLERLITSEREGLFESVTPGRYKEDVDEILSHAQQHDPLSLYEAFLDYETKINKKLIPCEQTPRYLFFVDEILQLFPDAKIINMIRDPRDVLISQKNKWKRRYLGAKNIPLYESLRAWSNYHPVFIAKLWSSCVRQGIRISSDSRVINLRFEDLLNDPEGSIQTLTEFVGIPFEPDMLNVPQVGSSSGSDNPSVSGVNSKRACGWKSGGLSKSEMAVCEWLTKDEMLNQGYTLSGKGGFSLRVIPSFSSLILKLFIAFPMNISRTKNIRETIRRRLFLNRK